MIIPALVIKEALKQFEKKYPKVEQVFLEITEHEDEDEKWRKNIRMEYRGIDNGDIVIMVSIYGRRNE